MRACAKAHASAGRQAVTWHAAQDKGHCAALRLLRSAVQMPSYPAAAAACPQSEQPLRVTCDHFNSAAQLRVIPPEHTPHASRVFRQVADMLGYHGLLLALLLLAGVQLLHQPAASSTRHCRAGNKWLAGWLRSFSCSCGSAHERIHITSTRRSPENFLQRVATSARWCTASRGGHGEQ